MQSKRQFCNSLSHIISCAATVALAIATVLALTIVLTQSAQAQTFEAIYNFTGGADGDSPWTGLTIDGAGNLYGTTSSGGFANGGAVFKLKHAGPGWVLNPLYDFTQTFSDVWTRPALAPDGTLYGATSAGGNNNYDGTVYHLTPLETVPKSAVAFWNETVLYDFSGSDGASPQGDLTFDQSGNIYGTTIAGGTGNCNYTFGCGTVYELTPSGGGWTETVLYSPQNKGAAYGLYGGVVFDKSGNLYGVFNAGGPYGYGGVYQLSPSGSGWTEKTLYGFTGSSDGDGPVGGLIMDSSGNLYGTTGSGGTGGNGTVFELSPQGGTWNFRTLYSFSEGLFGGPQDKLAMDAAGNLYGTTQHDGIYGLGSVFKLTPSGGGWTYSSLHDFTGGSDGEFSYSSVVFDTSGNLYGTAMGGRGCNGGCGVVWEITP